MLNTNQQKALKAVIPGCLICEQDTSIPAELTVAQWALESGWNANTPGNNCLGIKDYPGSFGRQLIWTIEWFNEQELENFLKVEGRTAKVYPSTSYQSVLGDKVRYRCQDWFATFNTLTDCFKKRASLFQNATYSPAILEFKSDRDIVKLAGSIAQHYATSPDYAKQLVAILSMPEVISALQNGRSQLNPS